MNFNTLLINCLIEEGVKHIYGLAGESNIHFLHELSKQSAIRYISTANETGAAFMAASEGRLTGRPGVVMTTLGPGALNACNGVAYSFLGGFPMVFLSWQGSSSIGYRDNKFQVIDITSVYSPIVKEAVRIYDPELLTSYVRNAFELSIEGKPGPILLEIPENISEQMVKINTKPLKKNKTLKLHPDSNDLETALQLLNESKKPLIINGVRSSTPNISKALMELVNKSNIPSLSTHMGQGSVYGKYHLGNFYKSDIQEYKNVCKECDLIITIGYDTLEYSPLNWNIGNKKIIIDIDIFYSTRHYQFNPDISLQGDIADTIQYFIENTKPKNQWQKPSNNKTTGVSHNNKIHPVDLVKELNTIKNSRFLHDNGLHKIWMTKYFQSEKVNHVVVDNTLASMGCGIPAGIVSKLVNPELDTYVCIGDGGLLMTLGEIATAKESKIDLTILIWNSNSHGMIEKHFNDRKLEPFGTFIGNYQYEALDQVFGVKSFHCDNLADLKKTLIEVPKISGIKIVNILVDYSNSIDYLP